MSFVSFEFVILFTLTLPLFYFLRHHGRWLLLLVASYLFYMSWRWSYILLIAGTTVVDFWIARAIHGSMVPIRRKTLLGASLAMNFGILFTFKYFDFLSRSMSEALAFLGMSYPLPLLNLLLPVGISFYTFQEVAYVIDVYRGTLPPERKLGIFATFIAFFPQLVAGPIERAQNLMPQFHRKSDFLPDRVVEGFRYILWGAFKKLVIADRVAAYVNEVYGSPGEFSAASLLLATFLFAFQIYCDFSGYSDMAIGTAKTMGFDLMTNFQQPYFSKSIKEFWQRWHISLSTWFKDYLYFPLGGNRVSPWRWRLNLAIVFLVSGLWHGANWTFVIWGALHGAYLVVETFYPRRPSFATAGAFKPAFDLAAMAMTFCLVSLAWIFFRATTLSNALQVLGGLTDWAPREGELGRGFGSRDELAVTAGLIAFLALADLRIARLGVSRALGDLPVAARWGAYFGLTAAVFLLGRWGNQEFIYFQF